MSRFFGSSSPRRGSTADSASGNVAANGEKGGSPSPPSKSLPFSEAQLIDISERYPTPFHIYDEAGLRSTCRRIKKAFQWHVQGSPNAPAGTTTSSTSTLPSSGAPPSVRSSFLNFFAVKATPNAELLRVMKEEGFGVDCSSLGELLLAESCGFKNDEIMFTSNSTTVEAYNKALDLNAFINLDDLSQLEFLYEYTAPRRYVEGGHVKDGNIQTTASSGGGSWMKCVNPFSSSSCCDESRLRVFPSFVSFRYNPGLRREGNVIIGNPVEAKFGITRDQLFLAYPRAKAMGATRFGLHAMVVSNCLDAVELSKTAVMLFELAVEIKTTCGINIEMINLGGGMGVDYLPNDISFNVEELSQLVQKAYETILIPAGLTNIKIVMENGRYITGPHGSIISRVIHQKNTYKQYVALDACMADLMRPGMYKAYHHITFVQPPMGQDESWRKKMKLPIKKINLFVNKSDCPTDGADKEPNVFDIVGGLCENNDKFAIDRRLPFPPNIGDVAIIHDAGAHGHSMGFQYNAKLRHAEYLVRRSSKSGGDPCCPLEVKEIRRRETFADYFSTLRWKGLGDGKKERQSGQRSKTSVVVTSVASVAVVAAVATVVLKSVANLNKNRKC